MNVLIACEESQAVTIEGRKFGHNVFSCDIVECSGGHPEWHIKQDVLPLIDGNCEFQTMDGKIHKIVGEWDMLIVFPPCTFLTNTGNAWFNVEKYGEKAKKRLEDREKAKEFFLKFTKAKCKKIVLENPIGHMSTAYRKPDQIVHPYYFAESENDANCERKATCFWFVGEVKPLNYEVKFQPRIIRYKNGKGTDSPWHMETMKLPKEERSRVRSITYPGIAKAMAEQWLGKEEGRMTVQEAIENLKYMISDDCTDTQVDFIEEVEMAIVALEKQIPKEPIEYSYPWVICPSCGGSVYLEKVQSHIVNGENTYCEHCGQALDWSDT